jgi:hypothetical protein
MAKEFNITGLCFPKKHYMADVSKQLDDTFGMIEKGRYFTINRPRQYGKTTALHILRKRLITSGYIIFHISFEGIGDDIFNDEAVFTNGFFELLSDRAHESAPELKEWLIERAAKISSLKALSHAITDLCAKTTKEIVLFIDEVDKSSNNQLFISFLAMLRDKYLDRERTPTFHSIVLAGVHDVKTLKLKINPNTGKTYNSPWNIATEFLVNMNLSPNEIKPMLDDYAQEQGVTMDSKAISELLFYYTSGYPYLTSHLCKIVAEEILPTKTVKEWTEADIYKAFQLLIRRQNNPNFDTLVKNLKDYPDLYRLVYSLVIDGGYYPFNQHDATINLGVIHGIFARAESGELMIHNRIYREIIGEMMISEWRTGNLMEKKNQLEGFNGFEQYRLPNNALDIHRLLVNFQEFMRQNYSNKDRDFLERDGRLIFLAFLKPIINGVGHDFKEPQISEERRLDVVITYHQHKYLAELKLWKGQVAHEKGLNQLADYLERQGLDTGFLLIFDHSKKKYWKKGWTDVNGKRIFWVRV